MKGHTNNPSGYAKTPEREATKRAAIGAASRLRTKHGFARKGQVQPEYRAWQHALGRCYDPNDKRFAEYGGRGIRVADEWRGAGGFERFIAHIGTRPSARHSLDRFPDTNGHYEPSNVRWATVREQANNKTTSRVVEHGGQRLTVTQWAERLGMKRHTLAYRLSHGWSVEAALSTAVDPRNAGFRTHGSLQPGFPSQASRDEARKLMLNSTSERV